MGIDLGDSGVKSAIVRKSPEGLELIGLHIGELREGSITSGEIKDRSEVLNRIEESIRGSGYQDDYEVAVSISGFTVLNDILTMDLIPDKEIKQAIMTESEQMAPFNLEDVTIDYKILQKDEENGKMKALLVAAKNEVIYSYVDLLTEVNLRPTTIDVDFFALYNSFVFNFDISEYNSVAILNIDRENADMILINQGTYHSSRNITITGKFLLNQLKVSLGINHESAVRIARGGPIDRDLDPFEIGRIAEDFANQLFTAVDTAISYFKSSADFDKLDLLALTGPFAWTPGLANAIEIKNKVKVEIFDPLALIPYDRALFENENPKKISTALPVALGLALRNR